MKIDEIEDDLVEDVDYPSQETLDAWPDCIVHGCENKCSLRLNSGYCHPHTLKEIKESQPLENTEQLAILADIRAAIGDPEFKLNMAEVVDRVVELVAIEKRYHAGMKDD